MLPTRLDSYVSTSSAQARTEIRRAPMVAMWTRLAAQAAVVAVLLCLAVANITVRRTWTEMEDGVLWVSEGDQVVARDVAGNSPAARASLRAGDILLRINGRPIDSVQQVTNILHAARRGQSLT